MKNIILKGIFFGISVFLTLCLCFVGYGAWVNISTQNSGYTITSTIWNNLINNVNTIGAKVDSLSNIPAGAIMAFNLSSCPTGWLAADGTNSTPDLRGEFIRGLDNGRLVDSGRTLGSFQRGSLVMNDRIKTETRIFNLVHDGDNRLGFDTPIVDSTKYYSRSEYSGSSIGTRPTLGGVDTSYVGMTRPRNLAFLYCIKQ